MSFGQNFDFYRYLTQGHTFLVEHGQDWFAFLGIGEAAAGAVFQVSAIMYREELRETKIIEICALHRGHSSK